ncbi:MAG: DUF3037 domain-containing protein [Chitinophagales bacterium]|nr:DUF3037 domain-containing protein [Chitinophagales bacterium]
MQEKHLYEYAIIRLVPRVEREEFLNVGVILYCADQNYLKTKFELRHDKFRVVSDGLDIEELTARLCSFQQICSGMEQGGSIAKLPIAERFRWLTAARSTMIQLSPVHPGLCEDAEETLDKLYLSLVQ